METIDMLDDVYECRDEDFGVFIFNPTANTDEDGWYDEVRYQVADKFNWEDEVVRDNFCEYCDEHLLTLQERNKLQYSYFELKYSQVLICLFNFKLYYDYQVNQTKKRKIKIKPYSYIKRYLKEHGFVDYWEFEVSKDVRLKIPDYFVDDFSKFLRNKHLWVGTDLWDFIIKTNMKYFFDSDCNAFDVCFYNYQESINKYLTHCGDDKKTDDVGLYVPKQIMNHEYEKRTEPYL